MNQSLTTQTAILKPSSTNVKDLSGFSFADTFEPIDQPALGTVAISAEIMTGHKLAREIYDVIIRTLMESFFEKTKTGEKISDRFEISLKQVNQQIDQFARRRSFQWLGKISAVVALVKDGSLYVTKSGSALGLLYREASFSLITKDLAEETDVASSDLFGALSIGRLQAGDKVVLALSPLLSIVPQADLIQIVTDNSIKITVERLTELVDGKENSQRVAAVIMQIEPGQTEIQTEATPAAVPVQTSQPQSPAAKGFLLVLASLGRIMVKTLKKVWRFIQKKVWPLTARLFKRFWHFLWTKLINKNPRVAGVLGLIIVAVLIIVVVSLIHPSANFKDQIASYKQINSQILTAEDKLNHNDKKAAAELLLATQSKIQALQKVDSPKLEKAIRDDSSIKSKISIPDLATKLKTLLDKATDTLRISEETLVDFNKQKAIQIGFVSFLNDKLYAAAKNKNIIYQIDPATKAISSIDSTIPADKIIAATTSFKDDGIYFLTSEPAVWFFSLTSKTTIKLRLSSGSWEKGQAIASYNDNIYLLSSDDKQIYRHTPTAIGFSAKSAYLKDAPNLGLEQATDLLVNGNIFVSSKAGFSLFSLGLKKDFTLAGLPANLSWPLKLANDQKNNQFYVLDATKPSIYQVSLTDNGGEFKNQFVSDTISSIASFTLDSGDQRIFVLTNNKVVAFNTTKL